MKIGQIGAKPLHAEAGQAVEQTEMTMLINVSRNFPNGGGGGGGGTLKLK